MLWFAGAIPAAIAAAKQRSAVFVVFVEGDDEQSREMAASWENEKVTEAGTDGFVAIKIDTKSEACLQFSQIYPVVCVPSSFFIGDNGVPLEVIAGSVSAEELITRIHKVKQMHMLKNEAVESSASCSSSLYNVPEDFQTPDTCEAQSGRPHLTTPAEVNLAQTNEDSERRLEQTSDDITAKVERVTQKLEERREEKKKEEKQKEIKREIERRKSGKEMLEYKRKQEEELTKRLLEERNREKAEDKAARERIRQQIALDRAERAARFARSKEEADAAKAAALQAKQAEIEARKEASQRERSAIARIQFRLPDGSSFTNSFPSDAPLEEARQFAAQTVGNTYGNFSLATMFPRREFTKDDYGKKLLELELAPSASVVLLPAGRPATAVVQSSNGDFWRFLGTILYPLIAVWRFISNFLFTSPPPSQPPVGRHQQEHSEANSSNAAEPSRQAIRKRVLEKRSEEFKKEGKIYRLRTQDDGDDDNNTWNGNSTQQM
ncbi:UBX domain-containing protein 4 [Sceloporus undulatus]|uniref:UBX domain-containing protein 4 n=1 Tax=Sceloporus undulatus TaxID=8520 RepID=UPI001C4CD1C7|nr:UBX domain-containing protein 4 [Sceloporus undulatus]